MFEIILVLVLIMGFGGIERTLKEVSEKPEPKQYKVFIDEQGDLYLSYNDLLYQSNRKYEYLGEL